MYYLAPSVYEVHLWQEVCLFKSHWNFFHRAPWGTEKKELLLCFLSLISETGGKFAAHIKNKGRKCIGEDKWSPSMKFLLTVSSGLTTMWNLFHDTLGKLSLETTPEMNTHLKTKRKETQFGSFKVRTLESKKYPLSCQKSLLHNSS